MPRTRGVGRSEVSGNGDKFVLQEVMILELGGLRGETRPSD